MLLAAAGGSATVVGLSSGAALAAEAALRGVPIDTLVMWEPPFSVDADGQRRFKEYADRLRAALADGRQGGRAGPLHALRRTPGGHDRRDAPIAVLGAGRAPRSDVGVRRRGAGRLDGSHGAVRPDRRSHAGSRRIGESRVPPHRRRPGRCRDPRCPPRGPARPGPQRRRRSARLRPLSSSGKEDADHDHEESAWCASGSSTSTRLASSTSTRSASTSTSTWCRTGSAGWWSTRPPSRRSRSCSSCRGRRRSRKASPSSFVRWSPPATSGLAPWRLTTAGRRTASSRPRAWSSSRSPRSASTASTPRSATRSATTGG